MRLVSSLALATTAVRAAAPPAGTCEAIPDTDIDPHTPGMGSVAGG
eukprot:COSAG01_NODE_32313_length_583_cov_0.993802_1_plen_45_part_10